MGRVGANTKQEDACLMHYAVRLTEDAFRDLEEIHDYIAEHGAPAKAGHVLDRMEK